MILICTRATQREVQGTQESEKLWYTRPFTSFSLAFLFCVMLSIFIVSFVHTFISNNEIRRIWIQCCFYSGISYYFICTSLGNYLMSLDSK